MDIGDVRSLMPHSRPFLIMCIVNNIEMILTSLLMLLPTSADPTPESAVSPMAGARTRRQEVLVKVRVFMKNTGIGRDSV